MPATGWRPADEPLATLCVMTTIEDRLACTDLLANYASAADHKDWARWRSLFGERVLWEFAGTADPDVALDALMARLQVVFAGFTSTQHTVTSPLITVGGDRASIRAHVKAEHWVAPEVAGPGPNRWTLRGFYDDDAVRTPTGWQFTRVRLTATREEGAEVRELALQEGRRLAASS